MVDEVELSREVDVEKKDIAFGVSIGGKNAAG